MYKCCWKYQVRNCEEKNLHKLVCAYDKVQGRAQGQDWKRTGGISGPFDRVRGGACFVLLTTL